MALFQYAPELLARYPTVVGGVILASGRRNGPAGEALRAALDDLLALLRAFAGGEQRSMILDKDHPHAEEEGARA